jgi:hypothetical protein
VRIVEGLLCERGIEICRETVRHRWNGLSRMFASDIRRLRVPHARFHAL